MIKMNRIVTKIVLAACILGIALALLPSGMAQAAGKYDDGTPPVDPARRAERLQQAWTRLQEVYGHQADRLARAYDLIASVQQMIDKATAHGFDTSAVQAALEAFTAHLPAAQAIHDQGAAILSAHAGFDAEGRVTDPEAAVASVRSLGEVLKGAHEAMGGTGEALREAIRVFIEAHRPAAAEAAPAR